MNLTDSSIENTIKPLPVEPAEKDWGVGVNAMGDTHSPFPRVNRFRRFVIDSEFTVDHERACLVTEAYKKYSDSPQIIKCAQALAHVLHNVTIRILPDELIVGEMAAPMKAAPIFPEHSYSWVIDEIKNHPWEKRLHDNYYITRKSKNKLFGIEDFWKGQSIDEKISSMMSEDEKKGSNLERNLYLLNLYMFAGIGHLQLNYEKLFALGYGGIKETVKKKMAELDQSNPENLRKRDFYRAELIVLEAASDYLRRYAALARDMAKKEKNREWKEILLKVSEN